jgi:hypothetical protein
MAKRVFSEPGPQAERIAPDDAAVPMPPPSQGQGEPHRQGPAGPPTPLQEDRWSEEAWRQSRGE